MDPVTVLGITSGIIAILQLTGKLISEGYGYIGALKDAPKTLQELLSELLSLNGVLSFLKTQLEKSNIQSSAFKLLDTPGGPLESCGTILDYVQKRLDKLKSAPSLGSYLVGPFKDKDTKRQIERLGRLKSIFQLALCSDQMALSKAVEEHLQKMLEESRDRELEIGIHVLNTDNNVEILCRESMRRETVDKVFQDDVRDKLEESRNMQQILGKHARDTEDNLQELCRDTKRCLTEDEERRRKERRDKILQWLSQTNYESNHRSACILQQPGTGKWFTEGDEFEKWQKTAGSVLWLHGIPGAGKTILSSTIIEKIIHTTANLPIGTAVVYFYFDFKDLEKQTTAGMLGSLIFQLVRKLDRVPDEVDVLFEKHGKQNSQTVEELCQHLQMVLQHFTRCYVVLDALDECNERPTLLPALGQLLENLQNTSILFTSRKEHDIENAFSRTSIKPIFIQDDKVGMDVKLYVSESMEKDEKLKILSEDLKNNIISTLVKGAEGMFRWVKCQLDVIRESKRPKAIQEALISLPRTLDDTYDRILLNIKCDDDKKLIRRTFQWVVFAARPMTLEEIAEAVVVEVGAESLDKEARLIEPNSLISICGSLFGVSDGKLGLAHYSVQEYLKSARILEGPARQFAISEKPASIELSKVCLAYLGFEDFASGDCASREELDIRLRLFPLLKYAANEWFGHTGKEFAEQNIMKLARRIWCASETPKFQSWRQVFNDVPHKYNTFNRCPSSTLVYPSKWGLKSLVKKLLEAGAEVNMVDVNMKISAVVAASMEGHIDIVELLILNRADVNSTCPGSFYGTALQAASRKGHENVVEILLRNGADVNAQGSEYGTALQAASRAGHEEVVEILVRNGADVNAQDSHYGTALQVASREGHEKVVEILLRNGADVNAQGGEYGTALQAAFDKGDEKVVEILLRNGADVNAQGGHYGTALQAASYEGHEKVVEILLRNGADVNAQGGEYGTALQAASREGHEEVVEILVRNGADVNAQGSEYGTALKAASRAGHEEVVEILVRNGADVNAQGGEYGAALQAASCWGWEKVVEILLRNGADVKAQGGYYGTALQAASRYGHEEVVEILVRNGADANAQGGQYGTALQIASCWGRENVVEILLRNGADVNAQGSEYGTALQSASRYGHEKVVEILLRSGADVNAQGGHYGTALQAASLRGRKNVVDILLRSGADVNAQGGHYGTALQAASLLGWKNVVDILLRNGAEPVRDTL